ncbi:hypothetical protein G7Y79_00003g009570 [Physcia stellaris]|nr:hypothetical protein G7Y79_00003g009570 [Physcia stellaris]
MALLKAFLLALSGPSVVWSSVLQPREQSIYSCNADNCLRQVRSNSIKASPYCTSYISNAHPIVYPVTVTSYTFVKPTVFHVGTGTAKSDYVTRMVNPYTPPGQKKREITEAPNPTPAAELEPRQAPLPTFASSCGNANRFSSACTCLIGNAPSTTTSTVPQNAPGPYRTVGVCGAPESGVDNHNTLLGQGGFNVGGRKISFAEYSDINDINVCCKKCYHSPECASFNLDPNKPGCQLNYITTSDGLTDANCPAGLAQIYAPFNDFNNSFGIGLCGYFLESDE